MFIQNSVLSTEVNIICINSMFFFSGKSCSTCSFGRALGQQLSRESLFEELAFIIQKLMWINFKNLFFQHVYVKSKYSWNQYFRAECYVRKKYLHLTLRKIFVIVEFSWTYWRYFPSIGSNVTMNTLIFVGHEQLLIFCWSIVQNLS